MRSTRVAVIAAFSLIAPAAAASQTVDLVFRGADVYTGVIFPTRSERGAAFGGTLWLGTAFDTHALWGLGLQYGSADRTDGPVAVRNVIISIDLTFLLARGRLYPYVGVTGGLISAEATDLSSGSDPRASFLVQDIDGYKLGGGGFGGLVLGLTETQSVGLLLEYRYVGVPDVSHQSVRAGIRFSVGGG